jgi:hypothetical protein
LRSTRLGRVRTTHLRSTRLARVRTTQHPARFEFRLDRADTVGPLGMTGPGVVLERGRVAK